MDREKIADYLDKQIRKHLVYDCVPEHEDGWYEVKRENVYKIVDGLIPLIKHELNKKPKKAVIANQPFNCVSSDALVHRKPCKVWCGMEDCKEVCQ